MDLKDLDKGGVAFVAAMLGVGVSTIYDAIRRGDDLPVCLQVGTRKVWRREVIEKWIKDNESAPRQDPRKAAVGATRRTKAKPKIPTKHPGKNKGGRPSKAEQIARRQGRIS